MQKSKYFHNGIVGWLWSDCARLDNVSVKPQSQSNGLPYFRIPIILLVL